MTSYESFKDGFLSSLAQQRLVEGVPRRSAELSQRYGIPELDVRECLLAWAEEGLIRLQAFDGMGFRDQDGQAHTRALFLNPTVGYYSVSLRASGREYVELLNKSRIGFVTSGG
jgi:hypothetical protein